MAEGKYPLWVRVTVGSLVLRIRNLSSRIVNETDPVKVKALGKKLKAVGSVQP